MIHSPLQSISEAPIKILFFGTPHFASTHLRALLTSPHYSVKGVITQPDRPSGRGKQLSRSPVKEVALEAKLPIVQPNSIRKELPQFLSEIAPFGPIDISVVVAFGQILPLEILSYGAKGAVNVHGSILPRWRGAAPIQRAIMAGDRETGIALMQMEAGLDTGPVYCESRVAITPLMTAGELHDQLAEKGAELLVRSLPEIVSGSLVTKTQPIEGVTYASRITNDEALIDWKRSALELRYHIHGLSPSPGAFTLINGKRLKVFRVREIQMHGSSGIVLPASNLTIACGSSALELLEVQLEGKNRCYGEEFIRGYPDLKQVG